MNLKNVSQIHMLEGEMLTSELIWSGLSSAVTCFPSWEQGSYNSVYSSIIHQTVGTGYNLWLDDKLDDDNFRFDPKTGILIGFEVCTNKIVNHVPLFCMVLKELPTLYGRLSLVNGSPLIFHTQEKSEMFLSIEEDYFIGFSKANVVPTRKFYLVDDFALLLGHDHYVGWILENCSRYLYPQNSNQTVNDTVVLTYLKRFYEAFADSNLVVEPALKQLLTDIPMTKNAFLNYMRNDIEDRLDATPKVRLADKSAG